jgi:hypothetical protein
MKGERIVQRISERLGMDIQKKTRIPQYAYARYIASRELRDNGLTLMEIGELLGINYATVHFGLTKFDSLIRYPDFKEMYEKSRLAPTGYYCNETTYNG